MRGTYYIPALTYSGLMPVVLLFPNFALSSSPPDSSNEHRLLTAPAGPSLFSFVLVYRALDLSQPLYLVFSLFSLSRSQPLFSDARDSLSESGIDAKAGSRKRRITKWSVTACARGAVYIRCRARFTLLSRTSSLSSELVASAPPAVRVLQNGERYAYRDGKCQPSRRAGVRKRRPI